MFPIVVDSLICYFSAIELYMNDFHKEMSSNLSTISTEMKLNTYYNVYSF